MLQNAVGLGLLNGKTVFLALFQCLVTSFYEMINSILEKKVRIFKFYVFTTFCLHATASCGVTMNMIKHLFVLLCLDIRVLCASLAHGIW